MIQNYKLTRGFLSDSYWQAIITSRLKPYLNYPRKLIKVSQLNMLFLNLSNSWRMSTALLILFISVILSYWN